ncbi:MAG: (Fe-S)-binding protein, partial [Rikenellaceae bacterium]
GVIALFGVVAYKYVAWFLALDGDQKKSVGKGLFSMKTIRAVMAVIRESLLHVSIFRHNKLLGYMHCSLAFGWFLLIVVGSVEVAAIIGSGSPLYVHIFFKYFHPVLAVEGVAVFFSQIMDLLLLFVLSGVALAWFKRLKKGSMGMRKRSKHTLGDKVALTALWFIFPVRLLAESITSGIYESGGFLTGSIGRLLAHIPFLSDLEMPAWWLYSIVLCLFFIAMPFSRYMHILTEIPHIFLKYWGVRPTHKAGKGDNFQIHSCSRCGICIDPCQLQSDLNINSVQAVYFLRNRRADHVDNESIDNCLMCGRCENKCPVGIDINTLRLSSRHALRGGEVPDSRYRYLTGGAPKVEAVCKVGYFAGCMTLLAPATLKSMEKIFAASGDEVWFADRDGGVCCGRPLRLSGDVEAAQKMVDFNLSLFLQSGITTLVTSCPICLKTFREDYRLQDRGIEVLHHTQYIERRIAEGALTVQPSSLTVTYHDPCELGRGLGIYEEPRMVLSRCAILVEMEQNRSHALCCGHSLANNRLLQEEKNVISKNVLKMVPCNTLITACPQCKSAFNVNRQGIKVMDISELVAQSL